MATVIVGAGLSALPGVAGAAPPVGTIESWESDVQEPEGITVAPDGTVWWTNGSNDTIGRVAPDGGITIFDGPGIDAPDDIAIGPDGFAWFTNTGGAAPGISRIDGAGTVTGVAAVDAPHHIVTGDGAVWVIDAAGAVVRATTAGAVTVVHDPPDGGANDLAVAPDGTVWFTTRGDLGFDPFGWSGSSIGWITPDGDVEVLADERLDLGGAYNGPSAVAAGADGTVWFAANGTLATIATDGTITPVAGASDVSDIEVHDDGAVWAVTDGHTVLRLSAGVATSQFVSIDLTDLALDPAGEAWAVGGLTVQGIWEVATDLTVTKVQTADVRPRVMVRGPDGNLWFSNPGSIGRLTPSGDLTTFPVEGSVGVLSVGGDGRIWFDTSLGVGAITVDGVVTEQLASGEPVWSMVPAPGSGVWVARGTSSIVRIAPDGSTTSVPVPGGMSAFGLATGEGGALWFLAGSPTGPQSVVGRIAADGQITSAPTQRSASAIVAGPDGSAWFTAAGGVGRLTPGGALTVFPIPAGSASVLSTGVDGAVWFARPATDLVGKVTVTGVVTTFDGIPGPVAVAPGPDEAMWVTRRDGQVSRITPAGDVTTYPGEVAGEHIVPTGDGGLWMGGGGFDVSRVQAASDDVVSVVARFSAERCLVLQRVADSRALPTPAQISQLGVELFALLAEAGVARPGPQAPNTGPCAITVSWPASAMERLEATAAAWGGTVEQLTRSGSELVLAIIWWMALQGGG
jgi:virginiamycin B lyase